MNRRIRFSCVLFLLCSLGLLGQSLAQTITTGFSSAAVCPGGTVAVTITTTGSFSANNQFSIQLSDVIGFFPASPTVIGTFSAAGTVSVTIPAGTASGSGYRIRAVSSRPAIIGAQGSGILTVSKPALPTVNTPPAYCQGEPSPAPLSAVGTNLRWYGTNPNGTGVATPTTPTTDISRTYYVSQTVAGCESDKAPISVTINNKPATPVVTGFQTACLNETKALAIPAGSLRWYTTPTGGTASTTTPSPPTGSTGSTFYYVSQVNASGCEGDRATIEFRVNGIPGAPTAQVPAPYCQGAPTTSLVATPASGATLVWWGTSQQGGTPSATAPAPDNQASAIYYVSQTANGCAGTARTLIAVTVIPTPGLPGVSGSQSICSSSPISPISAAASTGNTLRWWGTSQQGGNFSASLPAFSNTNTATYYVSQATLQGCDGPRASVTVTVRPVPVAPSVPTLAPLCQNRTATQLTATAQQGATLSWFDGNNQLLAGAPTPPTSATGTLTYHVQQTLNGCPGTARTTITVTVNSVPAAPVFTEPGPYCQGTPALPLIAAGNALRWYGTNVSGGTGTAQITTPTTSVVGTQLYYVTQTANSCESDRAGIPVRIKTTPAQPGVSTTDFCQNYNAPTLTASLVSGASVNWYGLNQNGGTASGTAPTPPNNAVGTSTYYVSQTLDGCEGPRAGLSVRVKPTPGAPGVTPVSFCNNAPAQPLTANGQQLKWYDAANNFISNNAPVPPTNNVGEQRFNVSQTNGDNCEGPRATLTVVINPLPGLPGVSNVSYCKSEQDQPQQNVRQLEANGQNLRWYNVDGNSIGTPTPAIDRTGTQVFNVSQTVNNCEGGRARLEVAINTAPLPAVPKTLYTYCINDVATPLVASAEQGGSLRWIDPYNRMSTQVPTPPTLNTNIDAAGDPFQVYQIGANGCYSSRATIRVVVNTVPTLSLTAPPNSVNLGQRTTLRLRFTGSGPYSYTLTGNNTGTSNRADTTISVLPRGNTTYQVINVTNGCGTGLPGNPATAEVLVRVPTLTTGGLSTTSLCGGSSLSVPFSQTGQFNNGNVFRLELASVADTSRKYDMGVISSGSPITSPVSATLPGGQYYVRVKASNPEIGVTGSNSPSLLTVKAPATATLSGTQDIYEGTPANLTITLGGDGPWTLAYADSLRSYQATTAVNPLVVEARPGRTTTYRLTNVSGFCGTGTVTGTATVRVLPLLAIDDNPLDPLVKAYPVPTGATLTVELDLVLLRDPAILSLTNMKGQAVLKTSTRAQKTNLDLGQQPSGQYLLHIQVGEKQTVRRVIKL